MTKANNCHRVLLGSINVRTCKDPTKLHQIVRASKKYKHDITFVQETHMTGSGRIDEWEDKELLGYTFVYSGFLKKSAAGVGMICGPDTKILDIEIVIPGRILRVRLDILGIKMNSYCVYAPTNCVNGNDREKNEASKLSFYQPLEKSLNAAKKNFPGHRILLAGDWNATIGQNSDKTNFVGSNVDTFETTDNGFRLCSFANQRELYLANTLFQSKDIHRTSWLSADKKNKKRLDYFVVDEFLWKCSINCRTHTIVSDIYESDHKLLTLKLNFPSKRQRRTIFQHREPKSRPNLKALRDDPEARQRFTKNIEMSLTTEPPRDLNTDELEELILSTLNTAVAEACPPKSSDDLEWYTEEFRLKIDAVLKEKDQVKRKILVKDMRKLRQKLKTDFYKRRAKLINKAAENRKIEEEFRLMREVKMVKKSSKLVCPLEKLRAYFENHFKYCDVDPQPEIENPDDYPHVLPDHDIRVDEQEPSLEEVVAAIAQLKNNKAVGTDGLTAELLKYNDSPALLEIITQLLVDVWNGGEIPSSWSQSRVKCLFKNKGQASDPSKYRGLSINSLLNKVLMMICLGRLKTTYETNLMPAQFGFRSGVGTVDGIYVAKKLINTTSGYLTACFVDLRAAFDHINRPLLFKILRLRTNAHKIVDILEKNYHKTTGYISGTKNTDEFKIECGVRQGAIESPCIFNIFLDTVLRIVLADIDKKVPNCGIEYEYRINMRSTDRKQRAIAPPSGKNKIKLILYADDIVFFCRSDDDLQQVLNVTNSVFSRFGLKIAEDKTQTMIFNADEDILSQSTIVKLNGEDIENVRKFRYLGYHLTNTAERVPLAEQISSAWSKWTELKHILCDREIRLWIRVKILESTVRARLLYAVQTDLLNSAEKQKLDSIWYQFLRKMVKGGFARKNAPPKETKKQKGERLERERLNPDEKEKWDWSYKFSNLEIRRICGADSITELADKFHLNYTAHVTRMGNSAYQKQLLYAEQAKPKRGLTTWTKLRKVTGIETEQLQKCMFNRLEFNKWINVCYPRPAKFVMSNQR